MAAWVAVDWGTSSLRGALLAGDGRVLEERSSERGILSVPQGGFAEVFDAAFGDWMQAPGARCLIAGMAGSRQGWVEAPYCACPAGLADLAASLCSIEPGRIAIVPGLSTEADGVPDVIRGEETQVFGALALLGLDDMLCILPGTHSKWVRVEGGRITGFSTVMTGEFYAMLRRHSILARSLPKSGDDSFDGVAFDRGIAHALSHPSLLQTAFSVRTLGLFARLPAQALPSYLSGLVIGEELRAQRPLIDVGMPVVAVGADGLTARYEHALAGHGVTARRLGSEATWRGLQAIAASW